jgi:hypothetical protein
MSFRAREDSFTVVFYGLNIFDVKIAQFCETRRKRALTAELQRPQRSKNKAEQTQRDQSECI